MTTPTPVAGPASAVSVAARLELTGEDAADRLEPTVAAVNVFVRRIHNAPAEGAEWPADIVEGAELLATRLYRRRNSPAGVATFTTDGGVYVQRNDPDVAMLLRIGHYAPPVVG